MIEELEGCDCDQCKNRKVIVITSYTLTVRPGYRFADLELESNDSRFGKYRIPREIAAKLGETLSQYKVK